MHLELCSVSAASSPLLLLWSLILVFDVVDVVDVVIVVV